MIMPQQPNSLEVEPLPAFNDNYLWLIHDGRDALIVDPGDATVVETALCQRHLRLQGILVTHHHPDHTGGIATLKAAHHATVYGPAAEKDRIPTIDQPLDDADTCGIPAPAMRLDAIAVPGHTLGHIAYHDKTHGWLFCGDTLFSGGCGRLFEGSPEQMHASLQRLGALPASTQVYCAHEYTLANLAFAHAVEPGNPLVADAIADTQALRKTGQPSLPSTIEREQRINPFLRCEDPALVKALRARGRATQTTPVSVFAELRRWKDNYTG